MGSVVLDAVNSFFGQTSSHPQQHGYREPPRSHPHQHSSPHPTRSRTPSRPGAPMSETTQRAAPAGADTARISSTETKNVQNPPSAPRAASRPHSPTLAAQPTPPSSEGSQTALPGTAPTPAAVATRPRPKKIKVRDLAHIQSFASEDMGSFSEIRSRSRSRSRGGSAALEDESPQYEISGMKVEDIIEMVAGLLTKITTTNDRQHEHLHRQPPSIDAASHLNPQTSSVLAFHGKNVPSITILSYLSRINKYCPTSYEVFLALLVYFDRMTERVNAGPMQSLREANRQASQQQSQTVHQQSNSSSRSASTSTDSLGSDKMEGVVTASTPSGAQLVTPPSSGSMAHTVQQGVPGTPHSRPNAVESPALSPELNAIDPYNLSHFFVVDSFNIHRLVIAGVTCASKFFSDIFYTNSRYAKVGGLPLPELNHLELQFLLLNDFRLSVPVEEIEAYGTMLVEFYAREVVAQQRAAAAAAAAAENMQMRSLSESSSDSTSTVRATANAATAATTG